MKNHTTPSLEKTAIAIDEADGTHYVVFRFRTVIGAVEEVSVTADTADHSHSLRGALVKRGLRVPGNTEEADRLFVRAMGQDAAEVWHYPAQAGWQRDTNVFLIGDRVIGDADVRYKPHPGRDHQGVAHPSEKGTLQQWQKLVAVPAAHSSVAMTAIVSAFAGPLLARTGTDNFLLNIYGASKAGKSTALIAATSVYGLGREQDLPNWNSTALGVQEMARDFNDIVLPMNEVGLISGPKKSAYDTVIRPLIYAYAQGRSRTVSSRAHSFDPSPSRTWRGIMVSTAEESFDELALLAGTKRNAGEHARCIEIPATTGRRSTIVDHFPEGIENGQRKAWAAQLLGGIRTACEGQHGTAIGPFVRHVIAMDPTALTGFIEKRTSTFLAKAGMNKLSPEDAHAARNVALIYAAGALAIQARVLPWSRKELRKAVLSCFRSAQAARGITDPLQSGKKKLREKLGSELIHRGPLSKDVSPDETLHGYLDTDERLFKIHAATFKSWFLDKELKAIVRWLHEKGYLKLAKGKQGPVGKGTGWAEKTFEWPDGNVHRAIVFLDPFKATSAKNGKGLARK